MDHRPETTRMAKMWVMAWRGSSSSYPGDANVDVAAAAPGVVVALPRYPASVAAEEMTKLVSEHALGPTVGRQCMLRFRHHRSKCSECPKDDRNIAVGPVGAFAAVVAAAVPPVVLGIVVPAQCRR